MKKTNYIIGATLLLLSACSKETKTQDPHKDCVNIEITASSDTGTKTHYDGTLQIKWDTDAESIRVIENTADNNKIAEATGYNIAPDGSTATFNVEFPYDNITPEFNYWGIYPSAGFISTDNADLNAFRLEIPSAQKPKATTFDFRADLLVSKKVTKKEQPFGLNFQFERPIAIVEMTLKGINDGEKLTEVTFSTESAPIAGELTYNLNTNQIVKYGTDNIRSISMTTNLTTSKSGTKIYFTALPARLNDFTVVAKTDKGTYSKTVNLAGKDFAFKANTFFSFSVNQLESAQKPAVSINWDSKTELDAKGGSFEIPYSIQNPVEGATLQFSTMYGLLQNVKASNGKITFTMDANPDSDTRKDYLMWEYRLGETIFAEGTVTVRQAVSQTADLTFTFAIQSVSKSEVKATCTPSDPTGTYILKCRKKADFDKMTMAEIVNADIAEYENDYFGGGLSGNLKTGKNDFIDWTLEQDTEYYLYAYGLKEDKTMTSKNISMTAFRTAKDLRPSMRLDYNKGELYPAAGGTFSATLYITNPDPSLTPSVKVFGDRVKFIHNITVTKVNDGQYTITYDIDANYGAQRSASIKVMYGELSDYIEKDQAAGF